MIIFKTAIKPLLMKKIVSFFTAFVLTLVLNAQHIDIPFKQATSIKFNFNQKIDNEDFKKLAIDYNNIVYVLAKSGLYRNYPGNIISKDVSYKSLSDRIPIDICTQEETGILFYLFENEFLTNSFAGTLYAKITPNLFSKIAVNKNNTILLLGKNTFEIFNQKQSILKKNHSIGKVENIYVHNTRFYVQTQKAIFRFENNDWIKIHDGKDITCAAFQQNKIYVGTKNGYYTINLYETQNQTEIIDKLPVNHIKKILFADNNLWFASTNGAFVKEPDRFRYFASKRWLDQNAILDAAANENGTLYFLTATGLNKIEFVTQTLAEKAAYFQDNIRKYHMRYGFVCATRLHKPNDLSSALIHDHDNDGLWTSFYLGSQAFRYATTGEKIARRFCWESFEAFERLLTVNPLKGFPSRTFERKGFKVSDPDRWRNSQEPDWEWKGTTSSDEYIAYLFVAAVMDKLVVETNDERMRIANFIDQIMTHIIENDYYFIDIDGKPTTWGRWNTEYVNMYPKHVYDRKLNSTHLIAGLQLAYALTGKEMYKSEAFRMMNEQGYYENMLTPMAQMKVDTIAYDGHFLGTEWNHSDDEMAFLTYWPLYHYAFNDSLKQDYINIISDHWKIELPERNALWNIITFGLTGEIDAESTLWHLREFKLDLINYDITNSHRKDLIFLEPNFREQSTKILLTPGERTTHRHNANPFRLDGGGGGKSKLAGDEFLLPYWMCRYYGFLQNE